MEKREYWSRKTNPVTGAKFEKFREYLDVCHNGDMDVDGMIDSEYGNEFARVQDLRFRLEEDPLGPQAQACYASLGLWAEMNEAENYYTRWLTLIPRTIQKEKCYPLIVANHGGGNAIETDLFCVCPEYQLGESGAYFRCCGTKVSGGYGTNLYGGLFPRRISDDIGAIPHA